MTDVVDEATRSRMMSGIRGKNTHPELIVRKRLHQLGLRFSLKNSALPGNPDLALPRHGTVVFVHGCFWHAHKCNAFRLPSTNTDFWQSKLAGNVERDKKCAQELKSLGWRVLVIWECAVKFSEKMHAAEPFEIARDWVVNYDGPYLEIFKGQGNGFSKRQSTARAL